MIAERVNAERVVLLGWSRAILLQMAHPLVAAGVAEHSSFRSSRVAAAFRLHHTVRAMLALTFGGEARHDAAVAGINAIHRRVNGRLAEAVGVFPAGTPYSAEDPELLLWVHATLLESIVLVYERIVTPLSDAERDAFCAEAAPLPRELGVPAGVPRSWQEVRDHVEAGYASGRIAVGRQAREVATAMLAPPLSWTIAPLRRINRLFAVGLLPPFIRAQYGFDWRPADERALERWTRILRRARRVAPDLLAVWPQARGGSRG